MINGILDIQITQYEAVQQLPDVPELEPSALSEEKPVYVQDISKSIFPGIYGLFDMKLPPAETSDHKSLYPYEG